MFWGFNFSLSGVSTVSPQFTPENRNVADILLRNDGIRFTDVSQSWNIPSGGNALGVTMGDFNNDSHQDLFVYRWGYIGSRISDYMLLNTGDGRFETVTMHGANDVGGPGSGDMGQAFDFDLDGDLDLLNGSEGGEWYYYDNAKPGNGHYALVRVGYAPESNVDAIAAEVILKTKGNEYRKRVGSAGSVFSQSLLNIVHFGLGEEEDIERIQVRWRTGEVTTFENVKANALYDTDRVSPKSVTITSPATDIRQGSGIQLMANLTPINADNTLIWSSSDDTALSVDENGYVKAVGEVGKTITITAKAANSNIASSLKFHITEWAPIPVETLTLSTHQSQVIEGQSLSLNAITQPASADNPDLKWSSSNPKVASVDSLGNISAMAPGKTTITVKSESNPALSETAEITVAPFIEPYIKITNATEIANKSFALGDSITLNVEYHAGTGNKVIASDQGGISFWLRHFKYKWIPEKDIILKDGTAIGTVSGKTSMTFKLTDMTPTAQLPPEHFYYLRASFAGSDGSLHEEAIYPINIIK